MSDQWFYARGGQQAGPVSFTELVALAQTGGLTPNDLVWQDGTPDWRPAGGVQGLFAGAPAPQAPSQYAPPPPAMTQAPSHPGTYGAPYQPPYQAYPPGSVPNYLVQAILVTVLCCIPFGIPGIVYAAQVNGKLAQGDYQGALNASKNAKMWSWIAFGLGLTFNLLYLLVVIIGAANS